MDRRVFNYKGMQIYFLDSVNEARGRAFLIRDSKHRLILDAF
jgi:hypothetical protein